MKRICLFCQSFDFTPLDEGESEDTPGHPMMLRCLRRHWNANDAGWGDQIRDYFLMAETCKDFVVDEYAKKHGIK